MSRRKLSSSEPVVYFTNDKDMRGPATANDWKTGTRGVASHLGLCEAAPEGVFNVYVDCMRLA
jgi:hypothetical protein